MDDFADSEVDINEASESIATDLFGKSNEEPVDNPVDTEDVNEEVKEEREEDPEVPEVKAPPQSWKKEMHEHWSKLDPEVQDYFELREQQMKEGIEVAKEDAILGRDLRDVLTPFDELLKAQGVDQKTATQFLFNAHYKLSTSDEQGKLDAINQIAQSYGINLDGSKVTPEIQSLQQEISQLKQIVSQSQQQSQQERQAKVLSEIDAFAEKHEYFDEVEDEMIPFLNTGMTLQDAYEKAIWANPVTRIKEMERLEKEKQDKLEAEKQEKAEKAKKAKSINVKTKDTIKAPTGHTGRMFDDFPEIIRELNSR